MRYLETNTFHEEIKKEFILVDFYADWCGPCRRMGEILEQVQDVDILKVNVDLYPEIAKEYKVMSIPTMILFKNGEEVAKQIGMLEETDLKNWLDRFC